MNRFRIDLLSKTRLKNIADALSISQSYLLEELINACFDSACRNFDLNGFNRFCNRCKERITLDQVSEDKV